MNSNKTKSWIQFVDFFESISCLTKISAHNFKNNDNLNKHLRSFYVSVLDINNAFIKTYYDIRNGKDIPVNLDTFVIPTLSVNDIDNTDKLKLLMEDTIKNTHEPLEYILSCIPNSKNSDISYLETSINEFIKAINDVDTIL
ncbi:MAG: hypothetical protein E7214_05555 [Clostridium sp.]|nr:hypothetical protein [Clostridium sp.]